MVYVLDSVLRKVMVFDNLGLFVRGISVKEGFSNPVAVAVNPDGKTIYVVDRGDLANDDHKVVAYSAEGKEIFRLGARGDAEGKFNIPLAAVVAEDNTLYVADSGNFRVQAFDGNGKFKFAFGRPGAEPGSFSRPRSIAADATGNIYVADASFNNVQIFDSKGQLLMPLGGLSREPGPGNYALIASVAVDEGGRLYINDHYFKKIEVFLPVPEAEGLRLKTGG
jgi:DNA-binding beta-propeller fold protein YncE